VFQSIKSQSGDDGQNAMTPHHLYFFPFTQMPSSWSLIAPLPIRCVLCYTWPCSCQPAVERAPTRLTDEKFGVIFKPLNPVFLLVSDQRVRHGTAREGLARFSCLQPASEIYRASALRCWRIPYGRAVAKIVWPSPNWRMVSLECNRSGKLLFVSPMEML